MTTPTNKSILIIIAISIFFTSCGTITHGRYEDVTITSNPPGAYVYVDEQYTGQTPQTIPLTKKNDHYIYVMQEGYQPNYQLLPSNMSPIIAGNLGFVAAGAAVGAITVLLLCPKDPFTEVVIIIFAVIGALCGAGAACGGAIVDGVSGGGYNLCNQVHAELVPMQCVPN